MTSAPERTSAAPVGWPPLQAVVFDWGGTLVPFHTVDHRDQWVAFSRGYGTMACALNDLTGRLLTAEDEAWATSREAHTSTRLDDILSRVGLDPDSEATRAGLDAYHAFWERHTLTRPDAGDVLERVRALGLRTGLLSNTVWPGGLHRGFLERDGIADLLDAQVYSSELAVTKPHPDAFRAAAAALDVPVEACAYVGDRPFEDVVGANRAGMRSILLPTSPIPRAQQAACDPRWAEPTAVAADLPDVVDIVAAWR